MPGILVEELVELGPLSNATESVKNLKSSQLRNKFVSGSEVGIKIF
jgi:N-acetylmuramoyl-L-alanine amidase